ncbi:hypothetical protein LSUE1_G003251 [Lachnellula suecica]|uniref:DUF427 domain-containing protein n=1 Tax=Lachnellula suecica TaxID=602035 RepID=A0A8T9C692_9HELO|nr:hypothetical protein LSUE1_G003251 [Lachnellula suecica]
MTKGKATAVIAGRTIAETDEYEFVEGNVYTQSSVNMSYLTKTDHTTPCPWKGDAAYYTIKADGGFLVELGRFYVLMMGQIPSTRTPLGLIQSPRKRQRTSRTMLLSGVAIGKENPLKKRAIP